MYIYTYFIMKHYSYENTHEEDTKHDDTVKNEVSSGCSKYFGRRWPSYVEIPFFSMLSFIHNIE
jgi:hypothetical protein